MHVSDQDLRAISTLWRELSEFPAASQHAARLHGFAGLARIIGACNVFSVAAIRDPRLAKDGLRGWRPKAIDRLYANPMLERASADIVRQIAVDIVDPMTRANVARAGATRAFLRPELVADAAWEASSLVMEALRPGGVADRIIGVHTLDADHETHIGVDRGHGDKPFGERERDLLHLFVLGCPSFHREQFMAQGLMLTPLTPREREVMHLLLTDRSERQIGEALGLTWRTTHQYAVSIFRKLGVKGRLGLMAYWLRHRDAAPL